MSLSYNGERYIPGVPGSIELEHMHRYALALQLAQDQDVLDVASGEGYGSHLLASFAKSIVGVDISKEAIDHARQRYKAGNLEFRQGSCVALPVADNSIDLVVSFETIEHHDQHQEMLREIERVLRPDGIFLISSPNKDIYSDVVGSHNAFHVKELDLNEFEGILRQHWPHVTIYGQRVLTASLVSPLVSNMGEFRLLRSSGNALETVVGAEPAPYYIALASKAALPQTLGTSAYESSTVRNVVNESLISPSAFELKCYWKKPRHEYSELQTLVSNISVDGRKQHVRLVFNSETNAVARIRLDVIDGIGIVDLLGLQLLSPDQTPLWQWSGDLEVFQPRMQVVQAPNTPENGTGCTLISLGDDPWFELDLPSEVYAQIAPGCVLMVELIPYRLLDRLPAVMSMRAGQTNSFMHKGTTFHHALAGQMADRAVHLSEELGAVTTLITQSLSERDQLIAQQGLQLRQMRDELLRAETQLDLLKDVMLGGREGDRL